MSIDRPLDRFSTSSCKHGCFIMRRHNYAADIQGARSLHLARNETRMFPVGREFDTLPQIRRIELRPRAGAARDALVKCTRCCTAIHDRGNQSFVPSANEVWKRIASTTTYVCVKIQPPYVYVHTRVLLVEMHTYRE